MKLIKKDLESKDGTGLIRFRRRPLYPMSSLLRGHCDAPYRYRHRVLSIPQA